MQEYLKNVLDIIAMGFELCGIIALIFGTLYTLYTFLSGYKDEQRLTSIDYIRLQLGRSIILALEFFVAGDIVRTVIKPDYYEIGILAILVLIRTVLTYFLNKEIVGLK